MPKKFGAYMIKPMIIAVIPAKKTAPRNVFDETNSFMIIGLNKISYFSTAVFSPSILITKPIAKV
jgi:hypothetical protein